MSPAWRPALANSSRFSSFKNLIPQQRKDAFKVFFDKRQQTPGEDKQSWKDWAGDKIKRRNSSMSNAVERISLFPGWASRRYHSEGQEGKEGKC